MGAVSDAELDFLNEVSMSSIIVFVVYCTETSPSRKPIPDWIVPSCVFPTATSFVTRDIDA